MTIDTNNFVISYLKGNITNNYYPVGISIIVRYDSKKKKKRERKNKKKSYVPIYLPTYLSKEIE